MAIGTTVTELAALRQQLWDIFNSRTIDDDAVDIPEFEKACAVEKQIENASFETDADRRVGLMILFELNDAPDFADQFKAKLFSRIHEFA